MCKAEMDPEVQGMLDIWAIWITEKKLTVDL